MGLSDLGILHRRFVCFLCVGIVSCVWFGVSFGLLLMLAVLEYAVGFGLGLEVWMAMGCVFGLLEVYYRGLSFGDLGSLVGAFFLQAWTESFSFHSCDAYNGSRVSKLHSRAALSAWRFERRMEIFLFIHARLDLNDVCSEQ